MRKIIWVGVILVFLIIAYCTKPDNKTIIIESVTAMWGDRTPTVETPQYYEQFMNLNSKSVHIDDWVIAKRVKYKIGDFNKTIALAAFGRMFFFK